jgi:hypothetical protein
MEYGKKIPTYAILVKNAIEQLPSAQPESTRTFVELVVEYPAPELCTYKEYKGKPYYSIKYIENGETHVGYGTYNPEVLSQYLKEYFISSVQSERKRLTNKEWIDFLSDQFDISRTSAREMLHGMMQWKKEDNFKKTFNSRKEEK